MADPALGIKDLLVTANVGSWNGLPSGLVAWPINIGAPTLEADQMILVNLTGGREPSPKWLLDYPSAQVMVRGKSRDYTGARTKVQAAKDALLGLPSQTINGDRWDHVNMIGDINFLGYDQKERPLFSINLALIIEPQAGSGHRQAIT